MRDYDPRPPGLRAPEVDPARDSSSGSFYLVGGVMVALLLVAGLLFFNPASGPGSAPGERTDQARTPERPIETPVETPARR